MPSNPSDPSAIARVEALLEQLARTNLQVVVVAPPDLTRVRARDRARIAAQAAGRLPLFEEAAESARQATLRAFARSGFSGTWAATEMAVSVASAGDRAAAAAAFEEAAMAAVVEDLVDPETLDTLRATADELGRSSGLPSPGSLASLAPLSGVRPEAPLQVAVLVGVVLLSAAAWLLAGPPVGLLVAVLGLAVVGWLARQSTDRDRG